VPFDSGYLSFPLVAAGVSNGVSHFKVFKKGDYTEHLLLWFCCQK